ncbi:MAG TPA: hypothetical protein VFY90_06085 [Tepidiformaceae bacterium]|nr:hypothetical protein [Tepidiformaceae bacterium]
MRNIVDLALLATRSDELSRWTVRDEDGERVHEAVRTGRSLVVVFPHVGMGGLAPVAAHLGATRGVVALWSLPRTRVHGWAVEERLIQGLMVRGLARARTGVVMAGTSSARPLRTVLEEPGGVVAVAVDVFWGPGATHRRSFMGLPAWAFHPGPARLARLARCPVVLCVPIRTGERELTVHWGPFIEPADPHCRQSDARVTDELISRLEQVLSEHGSDQYTYPMTCEHGRRWYPQTRTWKL